MRRRERPYLRLRELASGRFTSRNSSRRGEIVQRIDGHEVVRVLRRLARCQLRAGTLSLLLPATERPAGEVLQAVSRKSENGSLRLRNIESRPGRNRHAPVPTQVGKIRSRSEEHTSELQSPCNIVCRLLLEKKKQKTT